MKSLKSLTLVLTLTVGSLFFLNSCTQDLCKDVVCQNGGTCDQSTGGCDCLAGYEGTNCETEMRTKFLGSYKYNESTATGCGGFSDWPSSIAISSTSVEKILITGFGAFQCSGTDIVVEATVDGVNLTVVANQSFCSGTLTIISGSGSISGNNITISYTYDLGAGPVTCSGTYTKI